MDEVRRARKRVINAKSYKKVGKLREQNKVLANREAYLLKVARYRAKKRKLEFNLVESDIVIPDVCPILNTVIDKVNIYKGNPNCPSIDRIDSERGYVSGNIKVISYKANIVKNNLTKDECLMFAKNIEAYFDN